MSLGAPPRDRHRIAILGATGSIGTAAVDVVTSLGPPWQVVGLSGHRQLDLLQQLAQKCSPRYVVCSDADCASQVAIHPDWRVGSDELVRLAESPEVDTVVASIVGHAGLESTLAAVRAGKRVALANKETLVVAGPIVRQQAAESGCELLPVDSEHSAIFQCLASGNRSEARRLILTASGGPFRTWPAEKMNRATPEDALAHPTWQMGAKITVDSATMMNKALEIIEARWLFDVAADQIEVVVHPQSVLHSLVEFTDGSVIAQMSPPDMRLPIQYALTYPDRLPCIAPRLDRSQPFDLRIEPVDRDRFPAIDLGFEVARSGGTAGAVVNAANEQAVELFLQRKLRFTHIVPACRAVLDQHNFESQPTLQRLNCLDRWARTEVQRWSCGTDA